MPVKQRLPTHVKARAPYMDSAGVPRGTCCSEAGLLRGRLCASAPPALRPVVGFPAVLTGRAWSTSVMAFLHLPWALPRQLPRIGEGGALAAVWSRYTVCMHPVLHADRGDREHKGTPAACARRAFYLEALRAQLPRLAEGGALAAVLEHCMYCGMSLGRVGLDFRGLAAPLFEAQILRLFRQAVQARARAR